MGNSQQKGTLKEDTEELPKISHERFANRQVVKIGEEDTIVIKVAVPHQKEYNTWADRLKEIGKQEQLLLPKSHSFTKEGFCGLSGTADISYENYPFLLSDEIHNRECMGTKFFEEPELWYLTLTLLSAADFFHSQGRKVGDIRPENVFISEDGSVKMACTCSWPLQRTNYQKSFEKQVTYISPEEVDEMGYGKTEPSAAFDLAETFSIGLTLLDAATLSDSRDLYKGQKTFDYDTLENRLKELQDKQDYSRLLKAIIQNMCSVTAQDRTSARQLFEWLSPYDQEINNFEAFETGELPAKLKNCFDRLYNQAQPPLNSSTQYNSITQNYPYNSLPQPSPPREIRQHLQQKVQFNNYIPSRTTVVTSSPPVQGSVGFNYQTSGPSGQYISSNTYVPPPQNVITTTFGAPPNATYAPSNGTYITSNKIITNPSQPPAFNQPSQPQQVVESTYVPFNGKFSLDKIDEQLQQSRKMFPS